jgi:hypothetical protein
MSDLIVTVNNKEELIPDTVQTASTFLEKAGYPPEEYVLYRIDSNEAVGTLGEMLVFDEGDEFVVIPKHATDA